MEPVEGLGGVRDQVRGLDGSPAFKMWSTRSFVIGLPSVLEKPTR
jgi:hypothetical protein